MPQVSQTLKDISRYGRIYRDQQLAPLGLTSRHGNYLREICAQPGISQEQLTRRIGINKSNVARQVAAMEEEGYLERRSCGKDKRVLRLYPTQRTLDLLPQINRVWDSWETYLRADLTNQEQQLLSAMLQRIHASVSGAIGEEEL